jgi:hypothetical protein
VNRDLIYPQPASLWHDVKGDRSPDCAVLTGDAVRPAGGSFACARRDQYARERVRGVLQLAELRWAPTAGRRMTPWRGAPRRGPYRDARATSPPPTLAVGELVSRTISRAGHFVDGRMHVHSPSFMCLGDGCAGRR